MILGGVKHSNTHTHTAKTKREQKTRNSSQLMKEWNGPRNDENRQKNHEL